MQAPETTKKICALEPLQRRHADRRVEDGWTERHSPATDDGRRGCLVRRTQHCHTVAAEPHRDMSARASSGFGRCSLAIESMLSDTSAPSQDADFPFAFVNT
jgi:hypothetical protein